MTERPESNVGIRRHGVRMAAWGGAALLLLLPLIAMQFTTEVNWDLADFAVAAILIGGTGLILEVTVRRMPSLTYRLAVSVALAATFILLWSNGAVGIIGSEDNPANLLFYVVPAIAVLGTLHARFRPRGMAFALGATALAQALIAFVALFAGWGLPSTSPLEIIVVNGSFTALWLLSARLLVMAARH